MVAICNSTLEPLEILKVSMNLHLDFVCGHISCERKPRVRSQKCVFERQTMFKAVSRNSSLIIVEGKTLMAQHGMEQVVDSQ
jgi:hypothetical protein